MSGDQERRIAGKVANLPKVFRPQSGKLRKSSMAFPASDEKGA
jgi:hypothetical protein